LADPFFAFAPEGFEFFCLALDDLFAFDAVFVVFVDPPLLRFADPAADAVFDLAVDAFFGLATEPFALPAEFLEEVFAREPEVFAADLFVPDPELFAPVFFEPEPELFAWAFFAREPVFAELVLVLEEVLPLPEFDPVSTCSTAAPAAPTTAPFAAPERRSATTSLVLSYSVSIVPFLEVLVAIVHLAFIIYRLKQTSVS
jgi:hypothetical protein